MTKSFLSAPRALEIYRRDEIGRFGQDYVPAIKVTRAEAPGQSSPSLLRSEKIGRDLHLLSRGELAAALHALFLPELQDLHEQKMLQPDRAPHPLAMHPLMLGRTLPPVPGTQHLCDKIGYKHPFAVIESADGNRQRLHFPYVGDLLLILKSDFGLFCVNWTIKRTRDQFGLGDSIIDPANRELLKLKVKAFRRYEIEKMYYEAAEIRTFTIAYVDFDRIVTQNLFRIMCFAQRALAIEEQHWTLILLNLNRLLRMSRSINQMAADIALSFSIPVNIAVNLVYRAIWTHELKINLFKTLLPDRPLLQGDCT